MNLDRDEVRSVMIVSIGDLHWKSGYDYLLQSYKLLVSRNTLFKARIIGKGSLFNELNFSIEDLELKDFVSISEDVRQENVQQEVEKSDVFVLSDLVGGASSISLLQKAIIMRIPIVSTTFNGTELIFTPDVNGLLIPARNPVTMADAIEKLIKSKI